MGELKVSGTNGTAVIPVGAWGWRERRGGDGEFRRTDSGDTLLISSLSLVWCSQITPVPL
jgi:hypothetical protein